MYFGGGFTQEAKLCDRFVRQKISSPLLVGSCNLNRKHILIVSDFYFFLFQFFGMVSVCAITCKSRRNGYEPLYAWNSSRNLPLYLLLI